MKLRWNDTESYRQKLSKDVIALLLYGPNRGQVAQRAQAMEALILGDAVGDPFRHFNIDSDILEKTPYALMEEASTLAFGGERKLVRLKNPPKRKEAAAVAETLLKNPRGDFFLLVTADELTTADHWRKLFESAENAGAAGCYIDDNPASMISEQLRAAGIRIDRDALDLLVSRLRGHDDGTLAQEIKKLSLYAAESKTLTVEDIRLACNMIQDLDMDHLLIGCLAGRDLARLDSGLDGLYKRGAAPIMVIRKFVQILRRLIVLQQNLATGLDFKAAADKMRPMIFFKLRADFQRACHLWSLDDIYALVLRAQTCEANIKSGYDFTPLIVARMLQEITMHARRRVNRR